MPAGKNFTLEFSKLPELVGAIYDCALDPTLWPSTIKAICTALNCFAGLVALEHRDPARTILFEQWNYDPAWLARLPEFSGEVSELWFSVRHRYAEVMEAPTSRQRLFDHDFFFSTRWGQEMLVPYEIGDAVHFLLISDPHRVGVFGLSRHESLGPIGEDELHFARLLNPHIRRAVLITDVLNASEVTADMLGETLDAVAAGVVIVSDTCTILHANKAAKRMLDNHGPIVSRHGRLATSNFDATAELRTAVSLAEEESRLGSTGSGTPIFGSSPAIAHVLPLRRGERARLVSDAAAAVFVSDATAPSTLHLDGLARLYSLTKAETQILGALLSGQSLAGIARTLGLSESTVRTHRTHVFAKTQVSRRAELAALIWRLLPTLGN